MIFNFFLLVAVLTASAWYFPIANFSSRQSFKGYGQYIDKKFYIGRESLFPNQFTGYHAGTDLEIFPGKENELVPVYAITSGKIIFSGSVSGYGGVILENLDNLGLTALYGHVKIDSSIYKVGDTVNAGSVLTYLGDGFTNQTGGERKHLHFGIYKGSGPYFHGYEANINVLQQYWIDPVQFLKDKNALDPAPTPPPVPSVPAPTMTSTPSASFLTFIISLIKRFFRF